MARRVTLREQLVATARRAIAEVEGGPLIDRSLRGRSPGPVRMWAVGKAAAAMAAAAARALGPDLHGGLVITKRGATQGSPSGVTVYEAGHPIPDEDGVAATRALLADAQARRADER